MKELSIVPEPKNLKTTEKRFVFDGFEGFPDFLSHEFNIPKGSWKIVKVAGEGTGLEVRDREIALWGDDSIAYATILQLVRQCKGYLPEAKIEEAFSFKFRGYHVDIARGAVPRVETFKKMLRWLFLLKYNYFGIYFEDLFPWRKYPQIGKHRGRLSEDELKEVIEYGAKLGIEVFPSLELSGHMEHILSLPEFSNLSEWYRTSEGCLDLSNEKAREFAYEMLREVVDFFPSKYIHIGGDETWALGRGKSLDKDWSFEGPRLYELHHQKMIEIVKNGGKEPILWGDMIAGSILMGDMVSKAFGIKWAELLESGVWKQTTVANWDYQPLPKQHFKDRIKVFKDRGIQQIASTSLRSDRYYPSFERAVKNSESFFAAAREEDLLGFLVTEWGYECLFSFLDPLLLASMEIAEGDGRWQEKWMAISGEDETVLRARTLLGMLDYNLGFSMLKHVIFRDFHFHRLTPEKKDELKSLWKKTLEAIGSAILPEDLSFICRLLEIGIKVLEENVKVTDYLEMSNLYSKLWLKERKPEGLDRMVERFWSAAGREDMKLGALSHAF